jgi:hypothetical protein
MLIGEALRICRERYKEGMWIKSSDCEKIHYVHGRIIMSNYYYCINHGGSGCLWCKKGFAEIVEKPLTSKFYYLGNK